jgi:hypothetical protein
MYEITAGFLFRGGLNWIIISCYSIRINEVVLYRGGRVGMGPLSSEEYLRLWEHSFRCVNFI